jgi:hypothetical protein
MCHRRMALGDICFCAQLVFRVRPQGVINQSTACRGSFYIGLNWWSVLEQVTVSQSIYKFKGFIYQRVSNYIYIYFFFFWLCSPSGLRSPRPRGFLIKHDAPQSVGVLWTSDQFAAETSTWQHTTHTTNTYAPGRIRTHDRSSIYIYVIYVSLCIYKRHILAFRLSNTHKM